MRASQSNAFPNGGGEAAMSSTSFARQGHANNDYQATAHQPTNVNDAGPTSFASIYNKRNMYGTVNDDFARVGNTQAAQEQVQR